MAAERSPAGQPVVRKPEHAHRHHHGEFPYHLAQVVAGGDAASPATIEAVYVPTRRFDERVSELLAGVSWYEGPIYVMPTDGAHVAADDPRVATLVLDPRWVRDVYHGFETSRHPRALPVRDEWDLPAKRTFALEHARAAGLRHVVLMDDDIRGVTAQHGADMAAALAASAVVGPRIVEFPDLSVVDHALAFLGDACQSFMSGSCLGLDLERVPHVFPVLYNEDWLFILESAANGGGAATIGDASQLAYAPASRIDDVPFQEFGEILVGGLFELSEQARLGERAELSVWTEFLRERRELLQELRDQSKDTIFEACIALAHDTAHEITADECRSFVVAWDRDMDRDTDR